MGHFRALKEGTVTDTGWAVLPDFLLEECFTYLSVRYLGRCSQVCINWNRVFHHQRPWEIFIYREFIFTRRKFTQHAGWYYAIDHWRLRFLITNAARKWRHLVILPVDLLFNMSEFIRVLTNFSEYYERTAEDRPLGQIRTFEFNWSLEIYDRSQARKTKKEGQPDGDSGSGTVYGTGGQMLRTLKLLLS